LFADFFSVEVEKVPASCADVRSGHPENGDTWRESGLIDPKNASLISDFHAVTVEFE